MGSRSEAVSVKKLRGSRTSSLLTGLLVQGALGSGAGVGGTGALSQPPVLAQFLPLCKQHLGLCV